MHKYIYTYDVGKPLSESRKECGQAAEWGPGWSRSRQETSPAWIESKSFGVWTSLKSNCLQAWSVDISPSCCQVDVLAKPCWGPRGHGPKAGKQTGTPPLENLWWTLWSIKTIFTWSLCCRQVLPWDWQRSTPLLSPANLPITAIPSEEQLWWRQTWYHHNHHHHHHHDLDHNHHRHYHLPGGKGRPMQGDCALGAWTPFQHYTANHLSDSEIFICFRKEKL